MLPDLDDLVEDFGLPGIVAVVLLPVLFPVIGKPIAKAIAKGGILVYAKSKGLIAQVNETWQDIIAEAKIELDEAKTKELKPAVTQTETNY